jgi:drug/metabolite transporter (DMT)-like permease
MMAHAIPLSISAVVMSSSVDPSETPEQTRHRFLGVVALVGLIVCWSFVPVFLRGLKDSLDPWTANGLRYPLSALFYWPVLWIAYRRGSITGKLCVACLVPALFSTLGQVFWATSHYHLQASQIGFLVRANMVVVIVGSMLLFADERRLLGMPRFYVGLVLSIGGFIGLAMNREQTVIGGDQLGLAIIFFCCLFFGAYIVSVRKCLPHADPTLAFALVAQFCSVGLLIGMFAKGDYAVVATLDLQEWAMIAASSVLGIALGHLLLYVSVQRLGAALTTSCQSLTPFLTAVLAFVFLGERMTPRQWMSGVVIIIGALILLSVKNTIAQPPQEAPVSQD